MPTLEDRVARLEALLGAAEPAGGGYGFHNQDVIADYIATATTGPRIVIDGTVPTATPVIAFYTAAAQELVPGQIGPTTVPFSMTINSPSGVDAGGAGGPGGTLFLPAGWTNDKALLLGKHGLDLEGGNAAGATAAIGTVDIGPDLIASSFTPDGTHDGTLRALVRAFGNAGTGTPLAGTDPDETTEQMQLQGGVLSSATDGAGRVTVPFRHAFFFGVTTIVCWNANVSQAGATVAAPMLFSTALGSFVVKWVNTTTGAVLTGAGPFTLAYLALGA